MVTAFSVQIEPIGPIGDKASLETGTRMCSTPSSCLTLIACASSISIITIIPKRKDWAALKGRLFAWHGLDVFSAL